MATCSLSVLTARKYCLRYDVYLSPEQVELKDVKASAYKNSLSVASKAEEREGGEVNNAVV